MSIKKQYFKSKPECKLTFKLEKLANVNTVSIVGDFNAWDTEAIKMEKHKNGNFSKTINLMTGKAIQFRYLVNNSTWLTEKEADDFVDTGMGDSQQNAVIRI